MMATTSLPFSSLSLKERPRISGVSITLKYCGVTRITSALRSSEAPTLRPSMEMDAVAVGTADAGKEEVMADVSTPARALTRRRTSRTKLVWSSTVRYLLVLESFGEGSHMLAV